MALCVAFLSTTLLAKDSASAAVNWPGDKPVLHFEIGKFVKEGSNQNRNVFSIDVLVKNVSTAKISSATFHLYLLDQKKTRIADHWITLTSVKPGDTVKTVITTQTVGTPVEFTVAPDHLPAELASLMGPTLIATSIDSVPSGAKVSVDGNAAGITPVVVSLAAGTHTLAFEKDGYKAGSSSLTVAPDQASGRTITVDLGGAVRDTLELRDGTLVTGDLKSINDDEVVLQTGTGVQKYPRATVKRISLVDREAATGAN